MRVLLMEKRNIGNSVPLCYIHSNLEGNSCVDGEALPIYYTVPGEKIDRNIPHLNIVLTPEKSLEQGYYLSVNNGECVLQLSLTEDRLLNVVAPGFMSVSAKCDLWRPIKSAVLTVSDKASTGLRIDTSGPTLINLLHAQGFVTEMSAVVPDEKDRIVAQLQEWIEGGHVQLILTTGGTGLSPRDVTPEALIEISERIVPGLGELMRNAGQKSTPTSHLSRSLAVTSSKSIVVALPGSERGAKESFQSIIPCLRHAVGIINGWDLECGHHHREVHRS